MAVISPVGIPVVDMRDYTHGGAAERARFVQTLGEGLKEFGFITVENHGIDQDLIRRTYAQFEAFFKMDLETKRQYGKIMGGQRGYTEFGSENAKGNPIADLKEFWHTGRELAADHPFRAEYPDNVWPSELPELKETVLTLYRQLDGCVDTFLFALADYFKLPQRTFADMVKDGNSIMRAIHYPPLPADADPRAVRAAAHEDINMITMLVEATSSGLELLTRQGEWMPITALEGQIVVDAGDMLARVTNHVIPSTTHRVVNPADANETRYSLPFFVHPYSACDLTALDCFVSDERPRQDPPITAGEYLNQRLREIGLLK
ncbi:MAG TPA: 2-oxoglutarate and iron-dependent oxygenase domain-containing protein [Stenomitos sp.]